MTDLRAIIDLETTGLDASAGLVLEVGVIVVDPKLDIVDSADVVIRTPEAVEWAAATKSQFDSDPASVDVAQRMHMSNFLVDDILSGKPLQRSYDGPGDPLDDPNISPWPTTYTDLTAASECMEGLLTRNGIVDPVPLAGSSVRSLDGPFLARHLTGLFARFNHRTIDASALTEFVRFVDPESFDPIIATAGDSSHRTLGDCVRSLNLMRSFRDRYRIGPHAVERPAA